MDLYVDCKSVCVVSENRYIRLELQNVTSIDVAVKDFIKNELINTEDLIIQLLSDKKDVLYRLIDTDDFLCNIDMKTILNCYDTTDILDNLNITDIIQYIRKQKINDINK